MWEFAKNIIAALKPSMDGDPMVQYHWRLSIFVTLVLLILAGAGSFAWAQGLIPHVSGVALADDLAALKISVDQRQALSEKNQQAMQLILINSAMKQSLKDRCLASDRDNQQAMDAANREIDVLVDQYRVLTNHDYMIPSCNEILISVKPATSN